MFRILALRSSLSRLGSAEAWLKGANGQIVEFETLEEAKAEAKRLNDASRSAAVRYVASVGYEL